MKKLTVFYLEHCPYCRNARRAVQELTAENSAYSAVELEWIEESRQADLADTYDYYRVPSVFCGKEKLYEATPGESFEACKAQLRSIFDQAVQ